MIKLNLQRFAESGEGESSISQAAAGTTGEGTVQAAAAEDEARVSFEDLIKGEYKEDYDKSVQKILRQRLSGAKANEAKLAKIAPIMQALASKYGVNDVEDIESIARYVDEDESLYEDAAYKAGLSVDQYKRITAIEAENQRLNAERQMNEQRRAAQEQYDQWIEEAAQIQQEFPGFDLNTCLQDEKFQTLLRSGVDLRSAYIALDADNVIPSVMGYTAQQVAKKTANSIAQRGTRPMEGGMSGQASARTKTDVSKLSNAEIAELVKRATLGEAISFS